MLIFLCIVTQYTLTRITYYIQYRLEGDNIYRTMDLEWKEEENGILAFNHTNVLSFQPTIEWRNLLACKTILTHYTDLRMVFTVAFSQCITTACTYLLFIHFCVIDLYIL